MQTTARDPERQALVMQHTAPFRTSRAERHEATASDAFVAAEALIVSAEGTANDIGRALSRSCPRCSAEAEHPCRGRNGPLKETHAERAGLRELSSRATWHLRRANGQRSRHANLKGCGGQIIATRCACGERGIARPQGCGIYRACASCAERKSRKQRARFGRARGRVLLSAVQNVPGRGALAGARARWRKGGRYTDKMITLTIPHFDVAAVWELAIEAEASGDPKDARRANNARKLLAQAGGGVVADTWAVGARVAGLHAAFPLFAKKFRAAMKSRGRGDHLTTKWDRFFEWTPGRDGSGHPHFHVWAFSPFLCRLEVAEWWTAALRDSGIPVRTHEEQCERCGRSHVVGAIAHVMQLGDFDERAVRELMAGHKSIELAAFRTMNVGPNAVTYAAGWSIADVMSEVSPEVEAELYCALEGRRLSQGSAGLYADDAPPACPCCGAMGARSALLWSAAAPNRTESWNAGVKKTRKERPPDERERRQAG